MSYILDALKKSEQARGGRTTRKEFEELPRSPAPNSIRAEKSRRWLYCIALILFANIAVLIFRAVPRRRTAPRADVQAIPSDTGAASTNCIEVGKPSKNGRSALLSPAHGACKPKEGTKISHAHGKTRFREKTPSVEPGTELSAQKNRGPKAVKGKRVEPARGLAVGKAQGSKASSSHGAKGTVFDAKVAHLEALLAKQAEDVQKSATPALKKEDFADSGISTEPDTTNAPESGVPAMNRLPLQIRHYLPTLSVSMLVFSDRPSERFLYVNGVKRHEGDEISRGLKLERITREGAIFSYMGHRFYKSVIGD